MSNEETTKESRCLPLTSIDLFGIGLIEMRSVTNKNMSNNTQIQSKPIENREWLLNNGYNVVHQKTSVGYRAVEVESGRFVCSSCTDILDQENRAPFDALCPCCRFEINADKIINDAVKLGIIPERKYPVFSNR